MTQCWEEVRQILGNERVSLGPQASQQWLHAPEHLAMVLARYRAAAALCGGADTVVEIGAGEGIGVGILSKGRARYAALDNDMQALTVLAETHPTVELWGVNALDVDWLHQTFDAAVSLDVIEHIPAAYEDDFMVRATRALHRFGVMVVGTPNAAFEHLASPQSKAGHINNYSAQRLHDLMAKHFRVVQDFGMNDVALHFGHPEARHYLLLCGIGPR